MLTDIEPAIREILSRRCAIAPGRCLMVGLSGIDAGGKGFVAARLAEALTTRGFRVANINVDGWLNLPTVRFNSTNAGEHFYDHALRMDELFEQIVLPLQRQRSIRLEMDFAEETATFYRKQWVEFEDTDIALVEGIFLFKPAYRIHFDLRCWVDCTCQTALERALARRQEGLSRTETLRAYETIYFPAQQIHATRDNPRACADVVITNDKRLQTERVELAMSESVPPATSILTSTVPAPDRRDVHGV